MQMVTNSGCIGTGSCMWSCGCPRHALAPGTDILMGGSSGVGWVPGEGRREEGLGNGAPPLLAFGNTPPNAVEGQRSGLAPVEVLRVTVRGLVRAVGRDQ